MPSLFEIPLRNWPERFPIKLSNTSYTFQLQFRNPGLTGQGGDWVLDIGDSLGNPIVCGIPLVTGTDLLGQFAYLGFTGELWVLSDGTPEAVPTFDNLGILSHLYYLALP